jgi:hypothetical protein
LADSERVRGWITRMRVRASSFSADKQAIRSFLGETAELLERFSLPLLLPLALFALLQMA